MSPSGVVPFQEQTVTRSLAARTRVLAASAALLLAVGALAGCSDHPGQVADMHYTGLDGARHSVVVSEKDVDVVVKELDSALGWENLERQGVNRPQIAGLLVEAPYLTEVGQAQRRDPGQGRSQEPPSSDDETWERIHCGPSRRWPHDQRRSATSFTIAL